MSTVILQALLFVIICHCTILLSLEINYRFELVANKRKWNSEKTKQKKQKKLQTSLNSVHGYVQVWKFYHNLLSYL